MYISEIRGNRQDITEDQSVLEMGEYGRYSVDGKWYCRPPEPGFGMGNLAAHDVVENNDGTITVSPSILITGHHGKTWHGYLQQGIWRKLSG
jgi:hypothetical protein